MCIRDRGEDLRFTGIPSFAPEHFRLARIANPLKIKQLQNCLLYTSRLYLSERAVFDGSVPILGGIPVCFPQFGNVGELPKHGFVRTREWSVTTRRCGDDFALATLELGDDETTRALWPHAFRAEIAVILEVDRIDVEFCVENTGTEPLAFTGALHSYLRVVQVEDVALEGLHGHEYLDCLLYTSRCV